MFVKIDQAEKFNETSDNKNLGNSKLVTVESDITQNEWHAFDQEQTIKETGDLKFEITLETNPIHFEIKNFNAEVVHSEIQEIQENSDTR